MLQKALDTKNELHIFYTFLVCLFRKKINFKNRLINLNPCVILLRLSRWLCYGNVFILFFALMQHVVPLHFQWLLAQLFHAVWPGSMQLSLSFFDVNVGKRLQKI